MARNYDDEYKDYHGKQGKIDERNNRNKARRKKGLSKGDPREVDHKDGNPKNNSDSNLRVVSQKTNREKGARPMPYSTQQTTGPRGDEQDSGEDEDLSRSMDAKGDGSPTMLDKLGLSELMDAISTSLNEPESSVESGSQDGVDPQEDRDTDTDAPPATFRGRVPPGGDTDIEVGAPPSKPPRAAGRSGGLGRRVSDLISNR